MKQYIISFSSKTLQGFGEVTLDLKQDEMIKGSTLYGGGAIGGLINFISPAPGSSAIGALQETATTCAYMPFNPKDKSSTTLAYEIGCQWRMSLKLSL